MFVRYVPNLLSKTILQQRSVLYSLDGVIVRYLQSQIPLGWNQHQEGPLCW